MMQWRPRARTFVGLDSWSSLWCQVSVPWGDGAATGDCGIERRRREGGTLLDRCRPWPFGSA